jgi:hypothetical protein
VDLYLFVRVPFFSFLFFRLICLLFSPSRHHHARIQSVYHLLARSPYIDLCSLTFLLCFPVATYVRLPSFLSSALSLLSLPSKHSLTNPHFRHSRSSSTLPTPPVPTAGLEPPSSFPSAVRPSFPSPTTFSHTDGGEPKSRWDSHGSWAAADCEQENLLRTQS